jgi:hypothetical protein
MAKVFLTLAFLVLISPIWAGTSLRFNSPLYSFVIEQPDGWIVDVQSVSQIANFVVHPAESNWRSAPVVIFGRFVPRSPSETLSAFVKQDEERFRAGCAGARVGGIDWNAELDKTFLLKSFTCVNQRKEIVAVTELPSYFGIFILSGQEALAVDEASSSFQVLLAGFQWIETKREYWHPEAEDRPGDISQPESTRPPRY